MTNKFPIATAQVQATVAAVARAADMPSYPVPTTLFAETDTKGKPHENTSGRKFPSMKDVRGRIVAQMASG